MNNVYFCFYLLSIPSKTVNVKSAVNRASRHCLFLHPGQKEAVKICSVLDERCGAWPESLIMLWSITRFKLPPPFHQLVKRHAPQAHHSA